MISEEENGRDEEHNQTDEEHNQTPLIPAAQQQPAWFTPLRLLLIFCITNLFVYLDRGTDKGACKGNDSNDLGFLTLD